MINGLLHIITLSNKLINDFTLFCMERRHLFSKNDLIIFCLAFGCMNICYWFYRRKEKKMNLPCVFQ